jgi:hypothetical protein
MIVRGILADRPGIQVSVLSVKLVGVSLFDPVRIIVNESVQRLRSLSLFFNLWAWVDTPVDHG